MKIAMAHSRFIWAGGAERFVVEVSQRLAARHEITIYTSEYIPANSYPGLAAFPIVHIPKWQWATTHLKEDIIFTNTHSPNLLVYRNKHVAYCFHSFLDDSATKRPDVVLQRFLDKETMKRNQRIIAYSKFAAAKFEASYRRAVTDMLYYGVGPDLFNLPSKTGDYALYLGRIDPGKGLDRLVAWWQSIDYDLLVVGSGDPAYVRSLKQCNNPRITFLEPVFGEELAKTYQNCRFFVFLPYAEALGIVALEAMAAGKPVIAANAGGPTETIIHGRTGFLVSSEEEFRQAVTCLITSDKTCQDMGAAGRQHVQQFTWDNVAMRIEQIAQEMLES